MLLKYACAEEINQNGETGSHLFYYKDKLYKILFCDTELANINKYKNILNNNKYLKIFKYNDGIDGIEILDTVTNVKSEQEIQRILKKREQNFDNTKIQIRNSLKLEGINSGLQLLYYGTRHFREKFKLKDIGILLKKTINIDISVDDLKELAYIMGRNIIEETKNILKEKANISCQFDLIKYGINPFLETFGGRILGFFAESQSSHNKSNLILFGEQLGWTLEGEIKLYLNNHGIKNGLDLMRSKKGTLDKIKSYIGIYFGESINSVTLENRYVLASKLGWDVAQDIVNIIYPKRGKINMLNSLSLGKKKTLSILWHYQKDIKNIIGYDLSEDVLDGIEQYIEKKWKIKNEKDFQKITCKELRNLGLQNIGFILGQQINDVDYGIKISLGEKIGYEI